MKDMFNHEVYCQIVDRINTLDSKMQPEWGVMTVSQMLAHCNVTYEMDFENTLPKPNFFMKIMLNLFVKPTVVGNKPYAKNSRTAPQFVITEPRNFDEEKQRLLAHIEKVNSLGASHYDGRESHSFGKLSKKEWSTMFYKHLDHHLTQFGV